jgi:uncharacterized membrane protein
MFIQDLGRSVALAVVGASVVALILPRTAFAQPTGAYDGCGGMMGGGAFFGIGTIITWLIGLSMIAALVAVTVYLIRRSRLR